MKIGRCLFAGPVVLVCFLFAVSGLAAAQDRSASPNHQWLNGKWVGQYTSGGEMELTLQVLKGNRVQGWGRVKQARRPIRTIVNGTVNDGKVELVSYNPFSRITRQFLLSFVDDVLTGRAFCPDETEGVEVTFRKLE